LQKNFFYDKTKRKHREDEMDRGLSLLFRLMSASWVFIGNPENENQNKVSIDETDQDEWLFPNDGTFD